MTVALVSNRTTPGKIGSVVLDAVLSDSHEFSLDVTDFPIEDGSDINDHILKKPFIISLEGYITNTPLVAQELSTVVLENMTAEKAKDLAAVSFTRVAGAFSELTTLMGENFSGSQNSIRPRPIDIITGLMVYSEMVMFKFAVRRVPKHGESLQFSASFKKITKVSSQTATVPSTSSLSPGSVGGNAPGIEDKATSTADAGSQSPKQLKSLAKRGAETGTGKKIISTVKDVLGVTQ